MKNRIIVPTDLTEAGSRAIEQAMLIARHVSADLTLLHVLDDKSPSDAFAESYMRTESEKIRFQFGINCDILLIKGNVFDVITQTTLENDYSLMVVGTHGIRGVRQMLLGADILKLVLRIHIPVLVVQKESPLITNFNRIILPVASHESFQLAVQAVLFFAHHYGSEVQLYSIHKAGFDWPEQLIKNIEETIETFSGKGVHLIRVKEDQNVYSPFYSKQTLRYAHLTGADCICVMSIPSKDYYYFAQSDKEALLLNEYYLPVLCAGGGRIESI